MYFCVFGSLFLFLLSLSFLHHMTIVFCLFSQTKMSMLTGGTSCCIILTSLEVLKACKKDCYEEDMVYSLHFALLYQYARQKVAISCHSGIQTEHENCIFRHCNIHCNHDM